MRKLNLITMILLGLILVYPTAAKTKLSDNKIKVTETDTLKKKILLVTDLPSSHGGGYLDVELRVSKGGPNVMYSLQFEGVERAFGSINRDTPAEKIHLPLKLEDTQVQMYFWYTSGVGTCEVRVIVYLDEESGTELTGWGPGGPPPENMGFHAPTLDKETTGSTTTSAVEKEPGKTTSEKGTEKTTSSPSEKISEKEKTTPNSELKSGKESTEPTTTKEKETSTTQPTTKPSETIPTTTETKKSSETTPPEPQPPGEEAQAPGSE